ncbi:diadenosine tetraphosphate (Ap4A) HIT family hydrolase [Sporosarcina luteola]|nr:diadenosine tetraphosphate (Ap4A) HIT family hydrolase [Sporosarcina luteola]
MKAFVNRLEHAEHVYAIVAGDAVSHLHMHMIARYPHTPKEHWGPFEVYDWEHAPFEENREVVEFCTRLLAYLEET